MTKQEFIQRVAERSGLSRAEAARVVDVVLDLITDSLRQQRAVSFTGFGKFSTSTRAARMGVNPRVGARVQIAATTVAKFTPSTRLKKTVKGGGGSVTVREGGGRSASGSRVVTARGREGSDPRRAGLGRSPSVSARSKRRVSSSRMKASQRPKSARRPVPKAAAPRSRKPPSGRSGAEGRRPDSSDDEKRINAWVSGRGARRTAPLRLRETYELNINVGAPMGASLVVGDAAIDTSSLPDEGLDTEWVLSAKGLELAPGPGEQGIEITPGNAKEPWSARFGLHIPKDGDSVTRVLEVTPRRATAGEIDVLVLVRGELYRRVVISLSVVGGKVPHARRAGSAAVEGDVVEIPAAHTQLRTLHEWTTPPGRLGVFVQPSSTVVKGSAGGLDIDASVQWLASPPLVKAPIRGVRAAAETFRAKWQDYLNDIDPADVVRRLESRPIVFWDAADPGEADAQHEKAWRKARKSPELKQLAYAGRMLYDTVFAPGSDLRKWIDSLGLGHRLDISWQNQIAGWVPGMPWGLMYAGDPDKAVDPLAFLGLKLRIGYSSHAVAAASRALGAPAAVYRGNLLYWGSGRKDDAIAAESAWQRTEWSAWEKQIFWPTAGTTTDPRKELVRALARPKPTPVGVIYLYCQSSYGLNNQDPVLVFSDPRRAAELTTMDLGVKPLGDRPLVFANACTTSAGDPYESNPLEDRFFLRGCRAFLGTEIRVPIELASRFARVFFAFFYRKVDPAPIAAGEAVAQTRLFLWHHYRNIGGLLYTYVNQYELFLADDAEVAAMRS